MKRILDICDELTLKIRTVDQESTFGTSEWIEIIVYFGGVNVTVNNIWVIDHYYYKRYERPTVIRANFDIDVVYEYLEGILKYGKDEI